MKYTICGFSQEESVKLGLDSEDLVILRWFADFYNSKRMFKLSYSGKEYAWVKYSAFLEDMPIIKCTRKTLANKFKHLVDANVLTNETIKNNGTFSVYGFGENFDKLICSEPLEKKDDCYRKIGNGLPENRQRGYPKIGNQKTNLQEKINLQKIKEYSVAPQLPNALEVEKHKYGEYGWVRLSDSEHEKLLADLGETELERCITYVDESAQSTGNKNKWKDWNLVIRKCSRQQWGVGKQGSAKKFEYDNSFEEGYSL